MIQNAEKYNTIYSMHMVGKAYFVGKGVKIDLEKAADWARQASNLGYVSSKNELFDILWQIGTPEAYQEMIELITELANSGNSSAMGRLARAYREGKGVDKDLNLAAEWMRKAANSGVSWAKWEYFGILKSINTPDSLNQMVEYAQKESDKGNLELRARLARLYRDGIGVEKNLTVAAELMKSCADSNKPNFAKYEYYDILKSLGTVEAYNEMISVGMRYAVEGDPEFQGRIAVAYRDGLGVKKDLNRAAEWMEKASKNESWAVNDLFDILVKINTSESKKKAFETIKPLAEKGNGSAMGRLGRAYRKGIGTEADLNKSIEWYQKAAAKNVRWAEKELKHLLR